MLRWVGHGVLECFTPSGVELQLAAAEVKAGPREGGERIQALLALEAVWIELHVYHVAARAEMIGKLGDGSDHGGRAAQVAAERRAACV